MSREVALKDNWSVISRKVTYDPPAPIARAGSFTPEERDALRRLIHEECYRRDRDALLKLLGYLTLLKVAGSLLLLVLVLLFRWLR